MLKTLHHLEALAAVILSAAIAGLLVLVSIPCRADIAPESGLLMHVQAVSGLCAQHEEPPITHCSEITRSTSADGPVEFLLFFMRGAYSWPDEVLCLQSLQKALTWPESWQLMEFDVCGPGSGSLDAGGETHALHIDWYSSFPISDLPEGVVPVCRLVMNVVGPGRLNIVAGPAPSYVQLRRSCSGSTFGTYPVQVYAEAGMTCGTIAAHCGYYEENCEPRFSISELLLRAAPGGVVDTTIDFVALAWSFQPCDMNVDTHAAWCTAWDEVDEDSRQQRLYVRADAAALPPGTYETEIELSINYGGLVARCLPVVFTVENPTATSRMSWGSVKAIYRRDAAGDR